jgi:hypothetical protein
LFPAGDRRLIRTSDSPWHCAPGGMHCQPRASADLRREAPLCASTICAFPGRSISATIEDADKPADVAISPLPDDHRSVGLILGRLAPKGRDMPKQRHARMGALDLLHQSADHGPDRYLDSDQHEPLVVSGTGRMQRSYGLPDNPVGVDLRPL